MSLSLKEALKLFKFHYNENFEEDWIYYIPVNDFLKLLEFWKAKPPSKDVLEDFKNCINYDSTEYHKISKIIIDDKKIKDNSKIEFLKLFIHFGANKIQLAIATQYTKFHSYIEDYIKDWIGMPSFLAASRFFHLNKEGERNIINKLSWGDEDEYFCYWINNENLIYEDIYRLLKYWKENPPSKIVLKDLKKVIELGKLVWEICGEISSECGYSDFNFLCENVLDLYIYFGGVLTEECIKLFNKKSYIEIMKDRLIRIKAGQRIARNVKISLDDEFYLTELQKKIEMRRFEKLMEEQ